MRWRGMGGLGMEGGGGLVCQPASRIATVASRRPKTKTHLHAEQLRNHRRGTCVSMRDITAIYCQTKLALKNSLVI